MSKRGTVLRVVQGVGAVSDDATGATHDFSLAGCVGRVYRGDTVHYDLDEEDARAAGAGLLPHWARACAFVPSWGAWEELVPSDAEESLRAEQVREMLREQLAPPCTRSYVSGVGLRDSERLGYRAASVILWRRSGGGCQYLMAWERRGGRLRLNFLGGKRDSLEETPAETACREVAEETAGVVGVPPAELDTDTALWSAESKQAVFQHELTSDAAAAVQALRCPPEVPPEVFERHGAKPEGVVTVVWVGPAHLRANCRRCVDCQPWAVRWFQLLEEAGRLPHQQQ